MQILTPDQILAIYPSTLWIKHTSTRIKIIQEEDQQKESSFRDREGRVHEVKVGRCICVGPEGERWTCSLKSLQRDRYPVTEEDVEGYREYKMKNPRPVICFDIPFAFALQHNGIWRCEDSTGGIVTWNGQEGEGLDMRVAARRVFVQTYSRVKVREGDEPSLQFSLFVSEKTRKKP